jgi:hypothetical protein
MHSTIKKTPPMRAATTKNRVKFTLHEKSDIVRKAYPSDGPSRVRVVAKQYGISHSNIIRWKDSFKRAEQNRPTWFMRLQSKDMDILARQGYQRKYEGNMKWTFHSGSPPKISDWVTQHLVRHFDHLRSQNIRVTTQDLVVEYMVVAPEECAGVTTQALRQRLYRSLKNIGIVNRTVTHVSQSNAQHCKVIMEDFQVLVNQDRVRYAIPISNIVNADETNADFAVKPKITLHRGGDRTISATGATSSQRCTVMLACAADGTKLPPFIIFKGKPGARVDSELERADGYAPDQFYCVQQSAWMDEQRMIDWIKKVWIPFVLKRSGLCLLILDEARAHMTSGVLRLLSENRTLVQFIPGGYTSKLQVLDVGINRPFKMAYGDAYFTFVQNWLGSNSAGSKPKPTRKDVSYWIATGWDAINEDTITSTWVHCRLIPMTIPVCDEITDGHPLVEEITNNTPPNENNENNENSNTDNTTIH